jgi:hypothetical protein
VNAPKVVAGVAVLVLAAFWAIVLITFLAEIGYIVVFVAPFVTLLAVGFYGIINGLVVGPAQAKGGSSRSGRRIGVLAMTVLKMIAQGKTQEEIAAATAVSITVIEGKVQALTKLGYLSDNALSEKGFDAVREAS